MQNPNLQKALLLPLEEMELFYARVFDSPDGKVVLEDLRSRFNIYCPILGPNSESIVFKGGQQSVVIHIQNMINPLPEELKHGQHGSDQ